MGINRLIAKLELAAKRCLVLLEQEKEKVNGGAYYPLTNHHLRAVTRENFFKHEYETILRVIEELRASLESLDQEETDELIFLGRKLVAQVTYPWIHRKVLDEHLYAEIYHDHDFEPYAKNLERKKDALCKLPLESLGLCQELEEELYEVLMKKLSESKKKEGVVLLEDIVEYKDELPNLFKDGWTKKANLVTFRLYELGLTER